MVESMNRNEILGILTLFISMSSLRIVIGQMKDGTKDTKSVSRRSGQRSGVHVTKQLRSALLGSC